MSNNQGYSWPLEVTISKDGFEIKHEGQVVARQGMSVTKPVQRPVIEGGVFKGMVNVDSLSSDRDQK